MSRGRDDRAACVQGGMWRTHLNQPRFEVVVNDNVVTVHFVTVSVGNLREIEPASARDNESKEGRKERGAALP